MIFGILTCFHTVSGNRDAGSGSGLRERVYRGPVPALELPTDLDDRHVLALPAGIDVRGLALAWFVGGTWESLPLGAEVLAYAPLPERRFRGTAQEPGPRPGRLRLTAQAGLDGPWPMPAAGARAQGLPDQDLDLYALDRAVTDPLVLGWMTAAARRAGGAVVSADRRQLLVPDPATAVDLTLWTGTVLGSDDLVAAVRPALAGSRLGHVEPHAEGGYALTSRFEYDGAVVVTVERRTAVPVAVAGLSWGDHGPWTYTVAWRPPDPAELTAEQPSRTHLIARTRVAPVVARAARAVLGAAGGVVVDDGGFPVSDDELAVRGTTL